jgi:hypothetical protein
MQGGIAPVIEGCGIRPLRHDAGITRSSHLS